MTNKNFSDDSGLPTNSLAFPKRSSRGRLPDGAPNPVDVHIGRRIRQRRLLLEYSQEKIAYQLGITFQQVQKYEHGSNRVSCPRLWDYCQVLEVEPNYFSGIWTAISVCPARGCNNLDAKGKTRPKIIAQCFLKPTL